jgi:hypothetical protein
MQEFDRSDYVVGEIRLPLHRMAAIRIAYALMKIGVPGASWLYFRAFFGRGINFEVKEIDMPPTSDEYRA